MPHAMRRHFRECYLSLVCLGQGEEPRVTICLCRILRDRARLARRGSPGKEAVQSQVVIRMIQTWKTSLRGTEDHVCGPYGQDGRA
jgi:hypothetical protein